ncbi:MAG: hypothetical protein P0111_18210 [Nitrospira sp.]|nr:hypothetical protein [Nitrospira sp.]
MPEETARAMDPLGIVAIAHVIPYVNIPGDLANCAPEPIGCPGNCGCNPMCGCESKPGCCEDKCECERKPRVEDILTTISNPAFREVVQGLDIRRVKSVNDFVGLASEIRKKIKTTLSIDSSTQSGKTT